MASATPCYFHERIIKVDVGLKGEIMVLWIRLWSVLVQPGTFTRKMCFDDVED